MCLGLISPAASPHTPPTPITPSNHRREARVEEAVAAPQPLWKVELLKFFVCLFWLRTNPTNKTIFFWFNSTANSVLALCPCCAVVAKVGGPTSKSLIKEGFNRCLVASRRRT